jgi:hypothetical protein
LGEVRVSAFRVVDCDTDYLSIDPRRLFAGAALGRLEDSARMVIGKMNQQTPSRLGATTGFRHDEMVDLHLRYFDSFLVVEDRFLNEVMADFTTAGVRVRALSANDHWNRWVDDEGSRRAHVAGRRFVEEICGLKLTRRPKASMSWAMIADAATGRTPVGDPGRPLLWFLRSQAPLLSATAATRKSAAFWLALPMAVVSAHPEGRDIDPKVVVRLKRFMLRLEKTSGPVDEAIDKPLASRLRSLRRACPAVFDREFTPLVAGFFALNAYRIRNQRYTAETTARQLEAIATYDGAAAQRLAAYLTGVELGLETVHMRARSVSVRGTA